MKINTQNIITISGKAAVKDMLRSIPEGGRVTAQVVERLDSRNAVIEIRGKHINASFETGIPSRGRFVLVMKEKSGSSFIFSILSRDNISTELKKLSGYILDDVSGRMMPGKGMADSLGRSSVRTLMDLNLLLFGAGKSGDEGAVIIRLLNNIMKKDLKMASLPFFSYLFLQKSGINSDYLIPLLSLMGGGKRRDERAVKDMHGGGNLRDLVDGIAGNIRDSADSGDLSGDDMGRIMKFLFGPGEKAGDFISGAIPVRDGDEWKAMRYLHRKNAVLWGMEFSALGYIDILVRDFPDMLDIGVFCREIKAVDFLKKDINGLHKRIKNFVEKKLSISLYNSVEVLNECISTFESSSALLGVDMKA
ncbi:MAG TPA: hypothetical protein PK200_13745 [Spirochaetota bacterium]|nr:hypothetical protein [Spirochaetota bacterium]HQO01213.1 hypothetical protein [Spirochaetota bacterium]HQP47922.1 hypothetical protein [Spirochaetota bacterium]